LVLQDFWSTSFHRLHFLNQQGHARKTGWDSSRLANGGADWFREVVHFWNTNVALSTFFSRRTAYGLTTKPHPQKGEVCLQQVRVNSASQPQGPFAYLKLLVLNGIKERQVSFVLEQTYNRRRKLPTFKFVCVVHDPHMLHIGVSLLPLDPSLLR
jgi:hypothetical protein